MLKYLVKTTRSGFQNDQEFNDLAKAETFYKAECERWAPVTLCSFDPDDEMGRLEYIESYNP